MRLTEVDRRLMEAARLSREAGGHIPRVDMSGEAVDARLREAAELSRLCLALERDGALDRAEPTRPLPTKLWSSVVRWPKRKDEH